MIISDFLKTNDEKNGCLVGKRKITVYFNGSRKKNASYATTIIPKYLPTLSGRSEKKKKSYYVSNWLPVAAAAQPLYI